jgi:hypothetical protein
MASRAAASLSARTPTALLVLLLAVAGCAPDTAATPTESVDSAGPTSSAATPGGQSEAMSYVDEFGGSESVYSRILGLTDCDALESEADQAEADRDSHEPGTTAYQAAEGYMVAATDRAGALGC